MTDNHQHPPTTALHHRRPAFVRQLRARPRLLVCILLAIASFLIFPGTWRLATRILLSWNLGIWSYLALTAHMLADASHESIRRRAQSQDEGRFAVLVLACLAALASIAAIVAQLAATKEMTGLYKGLHVSLAAATILGSFAFIHLTFALHYAHEFVLERRQKHTPEACGLVFPGTEMPDYFDFLYFSFVIGVAGQTADVAISSQPMRRVALIHCVLSFLFNTTVLALTINNAAGLF